MIQLMAVVLFALSGLVQFLPCGQWQVTTQRVSAGYQLVINGCPSEVAALGTPAELQAVFSSEWEAHNYFLWLYGRMTGIQPVPVPVAI